MGTGQDRSVFFCIENIYVCCRDTLLACPKFRMYEKMIWWCWRICCYVVLFGRVVVLCDVGGRANPAALCGANGSSLPEYLILTYNHPINS